MQINFNSSSQGGETEINNGNSKIKYSLSCSRANITSFHAILEQGILEYIFFKQSMAFYI